MIIYRVGTCKRASPQVPNALDHATQSKENTDTPLPLKSSQHLGQEFIVKGALHSNLLVLLLAFGSPHTNRPSLGHFGSIESTRGRLGWRRSGQPRVPPWLL